jgi:nitrite reductase/ring-hydroxylating ferredoxin subunit
MAETIDTGTGYGRPPSSHDARLTEVGPGTPMGEALRRYWHPIAISKNLESGTPHRTRILGENLIVFRDGEGRPGVVFERCAHRGSSLFFGRVEDDGIRCCYHGWKFDVEGNCLEQPCEPGLGRRLDAGRQPWYPVEERYGLVFVYMGPPDRKPALPRYDCFEPLADGETYFVEMPIPGAEVVGGTNEYNWLQGYENAVDATHATWLHFEHSGAQFEGTDTTGFPAEYFNPYTVSDKITYSKTDHGVKYHQRFERIADDGSTVDIDWVVEVQVPNVIALPDFVNVVPDRRHDCIIFIVPADDTSHRAFIAFRIAGDEGMDRLFRLLAGIKQNGKLFFELTEDELQRYPGDNEAQGSQGLITQHSEEHLASADRGVVMLRSMLKHMVDDVEAGLDPINVTRDREAIRHVQSGVFTVGAPALDTQPEEVTTS